MVDSFKSPMGTAVAAARRTSGWTQRRLAEASGLSYATIRAIERGSRTPSDQALDALAEALGTDAERLCGHLGPSGSRVHLYVPNLSQCLAEYDAPQDGPVRAPTVLKQEVHQLVQWRLSAQYLRLAQRAPALLSELARSLHSSSIKQRAEVARLLVAAYRAADAVSFKFAYLDLSARLIELMRWAASHVEDPVLHATVAYVRAETFLAANAHAAGLQSLETALGALPPLLTSPGKAARGALHMRAAVLASRAGQTTPAALHLDEARRLGEEVPEAVYGGTAFGPSSVRVHSVTVAVGLGGEHIRRASTLADKWNPPAGVPAERRSSFHIETARAQLWAGLPDNAYESLKEARRLAPQHTREHPWVREDILKLRRLKRAHNEELNHFVTWCHAL